MKCKSCQLEKLPREFPNDVITSFKIDIDNIPISKIINNNNNLTGHFYVVMLDGHKIQLKTLNYGSTGHVDLKGTSHSGDVMDIANKKDKPKEQLCGYKIRNAASSQAVIIEKLAKRNELIEYNSQDSVAKKNPVYLEWSGINYYINQNSTPQKKTENWKFWNYFRNKKNTNNDLENGSHDLRRKIIENIHGRVNPGTILMNGHKPTKDSKRFVSYCTQHDIFFPQLTVRETLKYTALLRLPRIMSKRDKLKQVENVIQLLNLSKCSNTVIGNSGFGGISGGERKRVSIASELLTDPSIILLDEPTSGLDSSLALELTNILKTFALKHSKTIIMVIHQPSSQVFELLDKLLLMADGRMKTFKLINPFFKVELLNDDKSKKKLIKSYAEKISNDPQGKEKGSEFMKTPKESSSSSTTLSSSPSAFEENQISSSTIVTIPSNKRITVEYRWEATFSQQIKILAERSFKQQKGVILSKINVIQTIALGIVVILVWLRIPFEEQNLSDRYGLISFTSIFWSFHPLVGTISSLPIDIEMLSKERQSRSYRLSSYFIAKQLAELPLILLHPAAFVIMTYSATNLLPYADSFFAYLFTMLLTSITAQSFGYLFGAALLDIRKSISVSTIFVLTSMLLSGFYVQNLPYGLEWSQYLSFSRYSYSLLMLIQFGTSRSYFKCSSFGEKSDYSECLNPNSDATLPGVSVLDRLHLHDLKWFEDVIILIFICIGIRILSYYALRRSTKLR
nr:13218_t:CDS:10 [Entrophospora candida]